MEAFFRPNRIYAVAGASTNADKFGHKVLKWYVDRNLPVTPINIRKEKILGLESISNVAELKVPASATDGIALSVVTPPAVTKELIETIPHVNGKVEAIWLQPGTWDNETVGLAKKYVPNVITDCILVKGDNFLAKL
jgi:predicted CoA-binding protein